VHNYNKDGPMRYHHNGNQPVYAPNSYGGPKADAQRYRDPGWFVESADVGRPHGLFVAPARRVVGAPGPRVGEHDAVRWLRVDEVDAVDWLSPDRPFLEHLKAALRTAADG
jgi:hypothetical protein